MRKIVIAMLVAAAHGTCQTPAKDPDTLQALLVEVRQLRQDIEAMTAASQRVQIALHGLQMQDAAVARAAQRVDEARNKRMSWEASRDRVAADVQRMEASINAGTLNDAESKAIQQRLPELKSELDRSTAQVQSGQAEEAEATSQLRTEQAKLSEIQGRIERLDKVLEKMDGAGK